MNAPTEPAVSREGPNSQRLRADRFGNVAPTTYRILGEFAQGGIGRILKARDDRLDRIVALKELLAGTGSVGGNEERFVREALVTARLQHPSIVPIYEAGRWPSGEPFYAMKLVSGRSLADKIEEAATIESRLALLPHVLAAAEAMAYAHSERIIHRDLKPANVLIGEFGETVVIDWGLAKNLAEDEKELATIEQAKTEQAKTEQAPTEGSTSGSEDKPLLTLEGSVMGTPAFMPPEQAAGGVVDERADVYALGAILYHLLAGFPPYEGKTSAEILNHVLAEPPTPIERLQRGVPEDLLTIVRKAMAREAAQRYPTAKELADDLRRFQTGQIVGAHRYSRIERARRFVRRHKAAVSVAALAIAVFLIGATISVRGIVAARRRAEAERDRAENKQKEAEESQRQSTERADDLTLVEARASLARDPNTSLAWLKTLSPSFARWGAARVIAADAASRGLGKVLRGHKASVNQLAFSMDGKTIASACDDHTVRFWDVETGESRVFATYADEAWTLGFTPNGKYLVSGGKDKLLHIWDLLSGSERRLRGHESGIAQLDISPNSRYVATYGEREKSWLWDIETGEGTQVAGTHFAAAVAFSHDSKTLVASDGKELALYDLATRARRAIPGQEEITEAIAISDDDKSVAMIAHDKNVRVVDLATGKLRVLEGHEAPLRVAAFTSAPRGSLVTGDVLGDVRLWDLASGSGRSLGRHEGVVHRMARSLDGKMIATAGGDGTLRVWTPETGASQVFHGFADGVYWAAFSPDGSMVAGAGLDATVRVWKIGAEDRSIVMNSGGPVRSILLRDFGRRVIGVSQSGELWIRDVGSPARPAPPPLITLPNKGEGFTVVASYEGTLKTIAVSPDGERIALGFKDGTARILRIAGGGEPVILKKHEGPIYQVQFSTDGKELLTGGEDGTVRLWDIETGEGRVIQKHKGEVSVLGFTPDGEHVLSGGKDGLIILSDRTGGAVKELRGHEGPVLSFAYSPDRSELATGGHDHTLRLWKLATGESIVHDASGGGVNRILFSTDGKTIYTLGFEAMIRVWDAATGESKDILRAHSAPVNGFALSPDGRRLATSSSDRTVRLWDLETGESRVLGRFNGFANQVLFSEDGSSIIASSGDGTVRRWADDLPFDPEGLRAWLKAATPETIDPHISPAAP